MTYHQLSRAANHARHVNFRVAAPGQGLITRGKRNPEDLRLLGNTPAARLMPCLECGAERGQNCSSADGVPRRASGHISRLRVARRWINTIMEDAEMASVITPEVAEEVIARAGGNCEACGGPLAGWRTAMHHRKPRKHGDHSAANLMLVHGDFNVNCHNLHQGSIHANPSRSHRLGHILYENEEPAEREVVVVRNLLELRA